MASVSEERWQEAQEAERAYWDGIGFTEFRRNLETAMRTAEWARPHIGTSHGGWLDIGMGRLGISCTQFLRSDENRLLAIDPIEAVDADAWPLPEPCLVLLRAFQATAERRVGRGEEIDLPDSSFSVVSIENTLDHVHEPAAVLAEARRLLEPGGRLILTVDSFSALGQARFRLIESRRLRETVFVRAHPHRFSCQRLLRLVGDAGFSIVAADVPSRWQALAGRHYRIRLIGA